MMKTRILTAAVLSLLLPLSASGINTTTISFQQGTDAYSGAFDRLIGSTADVNGADVNTEANSFFIDGDPEDPDRKDYLIRFDNILGGAGIPAGATILGATLDLRTTSSDVSANSQSGESYNVYRLAQPFDASSTHDGDFGNSVTGVEPEDGEADFILGSYDDVEVDTFYGATVTRAVQSWVNGDPNYGLAVLSDHIDQDDGWSVHSTGAPTASFRPRLTVDYSTDPYVQIHEFQQGLGGYTATTDVILSPRTTTLDGSTVSEAFLDGSNDEDSFDEPYLIRFDELEGDGLEPGRKVLKAELILVTGFSSGASDTGGPFTLHQLLTPFDTSSEYADYAGQVTDMQAAGQIGPQVAEFVGVEESELVAADITSIVQNWLDGDANNGIYIGANGTANGWQIFTSGAVDSDLAPMLRVVTVPEPSCCLMLLLSASACLCWARRLRTIS